MNKGPKNGALESCGKTVAVSSLRSGKVWKIHESGKILGRCRLEADRSDIASDIDGTAVGGVQESKGVLDLRGLDQGIELHIEIIDREDDDGGKPPAGPKLLAK